MNRPEAPARSLPLTLARAAAVVLALGVLVWFVADAQRRANARAAVPPTAAESGSEADAPAVTLPSSKSMPIEPVPPVPDVLPAALSSSKFLVLDPPEAEAPPGSAAGAAKTGNDR